MTEVFFQYGCPQVLLSNNGSSFDYKVITAFVKQLYTYKDFPSPYNPLTNKTFERDNASILTVLQKSATENDQNLKLHLPAALFAY